MAGEPWCFHPRDIAVLTDFQVLDFYIRRQSERIEKAKRDTAPNGNVTPDSGEKLPTSPNGSGWLPHRDRAIAILLELDPTLSREQAEADYDKARSGG